MKTGMCKCLAPVFAFVGGVILMILIVASFKPDHFYVTRSAVISAPPAVVFEKVNNLQNWNSFSPWAKLDPKAKISFEGPQSGEGAVFHWNGNNNVGEGSMTIVESRPGQIVKFRLDFVRPFKNTMTTEFLFHPDDHGTYVTWSTGGENGFMGKVMSVFMNCEDMMGKFFDEGLSNLDKVVKQK